MRKPSSSPVRTRIPHFLSSAFFALLLISALGTRAGADNQAVRDRADDAFRNLEREAGNPVDEEAPKKKSKPKAKKPAAAPQAAPAAKPVSPAVVEPAIPAAEPKAPAAAEPKTPPPAVNVEPEDPGTPVTLFWHMADDADVYLNGLPLRDYSPSYRTRGDEAPLPAFSTAAVLRDGDVFTVGGRRGGSWGFMLVAKDASDNVVFTTDKDSWKAYAPGDRQDWFHPSAAREAKAEPVSVQPDPWGPQKELNSKCGGAALSIWGKPSETFSYLVGVVSLKPSDLAGRTASLRPVNYPEMNVRTLDSLGYVSKLETDQDKESAVFNIVAGLADKRKVSFESAAFPGHFLRDQEGVLRLDKGTEDRLFKESATFKPVAGLAGAAGRSFESSTNPGRFIRHSSFRLYVQEGSGELFQNDATFELVEPLSPAK